ncbi:MAG: TonB-dependent receptor [Chitinophagales bacterium]
MLKKLFFCLTITFLSLHSFSQNGVIKGRVSNAVSNEDIPFAVIQLQETAFGAVSNEEGFYEIRNIPPGTYNLICNIIGYKQEVEYEIMVSNNMPATVDFQLFENDNELGEVTITATDKFFRTDESPLSLRTIGSNEIVRNPGSNRDISKVIQSLPGVAGTLSYRNDILVRGGGPAENRFYLDGIEIPNINHFATQGSTGGPVGLLNVDFIREADFYSGAFPANLGNALSSVLVLKNKTGRTDRWGGTGTFTYTASGISLEGPLGTKASALLSVRQSYLQVLFKQIGLPFLPTFNDYEAKISIQPDKKNQLNILLLGAIDRFAFNPDAVNNKDSVRSEYAKYILGYLPSNDQTTNAGGVVWKHFREKDFLTVVASANQLHNESSKYENNDESSEANKIFTYNSDETEIKLRAENNRYMQNGFSYMYGVGLEQAFYTNATFNKITTPFGIDTVNFSSRLQFLKYSIFTQLTKKYFTETLTLSIGLRTDANTYSTEMSNPIEQLSPRFSASYKLSENANLNFNTGLYFQLPGYTILGYRNTEGELVNKNNGVTFIRSKHLVFGTDYYTRFSAKISLEGFYKLYDRYPFSIVNQVSLANLGGDFGVIGNEAVESTANGRAYGAELSYQQKLFKGWYGLFTYTFVKSEFQDTTETYVSSSWDYGNIINLTLGKKFKGDWEIGAKIRYQGGQPFTPFDTAYSLLTYVWDINQTGQLDYSKLASERSEELFNLDLRVDKKWFFNKWTLTLYGDVQNILDTKTLQQSFLSVQTDESGNPLINPEDPSRYIPKFITNTNGVRTPNIGVVVEI